MTTRSKECFCETCNKRFHHLGIMRHKAMHRDKRERCVITYTHGDTYEYNYDEEV